MNHSLNPSEQHQEVLTDISHSFTSLVLPFEPLLKPFTNSFETPTVKDVPIKKDMNDIISQSSSQSSSTFDASYTTPSIEDDLKLHNLKINKILEDINNILHSPNDALTDVPSLILITPCSLYSIPSSVLPTFSTPSSFNTHPSMFDI